MGHVYIAKCPDYSAQHVRRAFRESLHGLGDIRSVIRPGQTVVLKPNLLQAQPPEKAITTHPALVTAVAAWVREIGATPIIADSPGGLLSVHKLRRLYEVTGMMRAAQEGNALLNEDTRTTSISCPEGRASQKYDAMRAMAEADAIISLPKLKTHGLVQFTGAIKNIFGTVPGVRKGAYHAKFPSVDRFSAMLIDLLTFYRPVLTVMDAITGMEGDGPSGGEPRSVGLILTSIDPVALDVVAASLLGMTSSNVPPIAAAARRGLTTGRLGDIDILGERPDEVTVEDFKRPRTGSARARMLPSSVPEWITNQLLASPQAGPNCTACGICAENCPVQAITIVGSRARTDLERCIRCFCCHELCPEDAVQLRLPLLARLFG